MCFSTFFPPKVTSLVTLGQGHRSGKTPADCPVCDKVTVAIKGEKLICTMGVIELLSAALQEIVADVPPASLIHVMALEGADELVRGGR